MSGSGLFTLIELLIRTVVNLVRRIGSSDWPVIEAIITESEQRIFTFGFGRVIVLRYRYRNADQRFEGVYGEPFYFDNYATAYLNRFPGGTAFLVRVNPKDLSRSVPDNPKVEFIKVK